MKGRSEFTRDEIDELYRLVRRKHGASVSKQKQIRAQMRDVGLYVTDFGYQGHGFRDTDLDRLIQKGAVRVTDDETDRVLWWRRPIRALRRWWA